MRRFEFSDMFTNVVGSTREDTNLFSYEQTKKTIDSSSQILL